MINCLDKQDFRVAERNKVEGSSAVDIGEQDLIIIEKMARTIALTEFPVCGASSPGSAAPILPMTGG